MFFSPNNIIFLFFSSNFCYYSILFISFSQIHDFFLFLCIRSLKGLGLYSLQRRRERYYIIYIWKIIEGLAPNFSNPSTCSGRRGRSCVISHVNVRRVGTLSHNSFRWRSIRLFNSLPMHLRSISSCSVLRFKTQLDIFLGSVEDLPCLPGFNNSLDGGDCRWWSPRDGLATN